MVEAIVQSFRGLYDLKIPSDACVSHLEDRLQGLYNTSKVLALVVLGLQGKKITATALAADMGLSPHDVPLLAALASTHTPGVLDQVIVN